MIAKSESRGITIKVSTHVAGRPTSGWLSNSSVFWRSLGDLEAHYVNAMNVVPLDTFEARPDDWEVKK